MAWAPPAADFQLPDKGWSPPDSDFSGSVPLLPQRDTERSGANPYISMALDAVGRTPLGMAAEGAGAMQEGINRVMTPLIPVGDRFRKTVSPLFQGSRALGVGVAQNVVSPQTPEAILKTGEEMRRAYQPGYVPRNAVTKAGAMIGENAPAMAATALSPNIGGPLVFGAQQVAETGKFSPVPLAMGGANKVFGLPIVNKAMSGTEKLLAGGVEKVTGIPAENSIAAFDKPKALFTAPNQKEVAAAYAKSEFPELAQNLDEMIDAGTKSYSAKVKAGADAIRQYVEKGAQDPKKIINGRQNLDRQMAMLENQIKISKGPGKTALLKAYDAKLALRDMFNRALDKMAPKYRAADKLASERFEIAPFRNVTLPGKINLFSPEGLLRAVPGLPSVIGAGISGAGAATKGVGAVLRQAPAVNTATPVAKVLDEQTALQILDEVGNDVAKARQLAAIRGFQIPAVAQ